MRPATSAKTVRLATFNINGIRARLPNLLAWLQRESPDIVCLQELKATDAAFPRQAIAEAGYAAVWVGQVSWNGVAILSKGIEPVEIRRQLPGAPDDAQARYLEAAVQGLIVACLYLPNGNPQPGPKFDYKLAWFERLIRHAKGLYSSGHPAALVGDFNVVPTDFDIYDPKSWRRDALLQPQSRACYERLLSQGWRDSLRHCHPDARVYTFWDYFRQHWQRNAGLRIDHVLLNPSLKRRLKRAGVDTWVRGEPGASDHAPVWVELSVPARARNAPAAKKTASSRSRKRVTNPS
ncbi:exodeoxyribonuclease III [Tahibacter amnicola]|uniref:Exodeoxyribonuclease III n=1 Tax=Tahibacter amnicola TaxID=2976241 RepID=A0ABY6BA09_9GAMM|nr:exodeoxyribonuclease III [Tahibacter amnicola]UXI66376.1 exodeoxyribonuclease III [Tahibacter amnicola]